MGLAPVGKCPTLENKGLSVGCLTDTPIAGSILHDRQKNEWGWDSVLSHPCNGSEE